MMCYGIIMVWYGVIMMLCDIIEDLKKYNITGLEWLCKEPNRVIESQRNVKMCDWHLTDGVTDFMTDYVTDTWGANKVIIKIWELQQYCLISDLRPNIF